MNLFLLLTLVTYGGGLCASAVVDSDSDENAGTDKMLTDKIERLEAQNRDLTDLANNFCRSFQILQRDGAAVYNTGDI